MEGEHASRLTDVVSLKGRDFSRTLILGFPISHRRAKRSFWGLVALNAREQAERDVGVVVSRGTFSFCRYFPGTGLPPV